MDTPRNNRADAFLAAYRVCANVTRAAEAANIRRETHYKRLEADPKYREAFNRARVDAGQSLEDEAVERATRGVFKPFSYQGRPTFEQVWNETAERWEDDPAKPLGAWERSDSLLLATLKAFLPHRYRERASVEMSGPEGGPIPLETGRLKALTDEELATLTALARKLQAAEPPTE